jgi:hypothetical protein
MTSKGSGRTSLRVFLEGKLDAEIVDLRLFDFALPKSKAKIEITYIEVKVLMSLPGYSILDPNGKKEERIVLKPKDVKGLRILCLGYEEVPINLGAFSSDSGSFPLSQTWTRPKRLRYPVQAELTFEIKVKDMRFFTKPHSVTLTGTSSIFDHCVTQ